MKVSRLRFQPDLALAIYQRRKRVTRRLPHYTQHDYNEPPEIVEECHLGGARDLLWVPERWRINDAAATIQYPGRVEESRTVDRVWLSPRSMPRWAARLWLAIASVRQENLQEITEEEAVLEGFAAIRETLGLRAVSAREQFIDRWNRIYERSTRVADVAWKDDPVVWRVEFDPVSVEMARGLMSDAGIKP